MNKDNSVLILRWGVHIAAAITAVIGAYWLVAWLGGWAAQWSAAGAITPKINMALCQLLGGAALLLQQHASSRQRRALVSAIALFVLIVGALTLSEHIFNYDLGIDQLLVRDAPNAAATASPNRMGPPGSLCWILLGAGLFALAWGRKAIASSFGMAVCIINLIPAVGFIYGVEQFYSKPHLTGIAWETVVALISLGAGLMLSQPESGIAAVLLRRNAGGLLLRTMLPAVILIPLVLGFILVYGQNHRVFDAAMSMGVFVIFLILLFIVILGHSAANLIRVEEEAKHLSSFPEYNPSPVIEVDFSGKITYANPATIKVLKESGKKNTDKALFLPHDLSEILKKAQEEERCFIREISIGDRVFLESISLLPQFKSIRIYAADFTERKRVEEELREARLDLERAQAVGNIGNWRLNIKRNELIWSEENYRIFGVPIGSPLTYETFLSMVHPDDRDHVDRKWKAAIEGADYDIEHRIVADGKVKWVREKAFLEFDKEGALLSGFGITQDITDRKRAEAQLSESEERLQSALVIGRSFAFEWNPVSDKVIRSDSCGSILGLSGEEAIFDTGKNYFQRIHTDDRERFVNLLKALKPGNGIYKIEYRIARGDGSIVVLEEVAQASFDADGKLVRLVGTATDITTRKAAEEVLKRDEETLRRLVEEQTHDLLLAQTELESAKRLSDIGVLSATVAHELRNPLAAIQMAAANIKRKADNPDLDKHLANIAKKVGESDQIINNLLFYSRLKSPHYENISILDVIEDSINALEQKKKKEVAVVKNLDPLKGVSIEADPLQLAEVFNNVLNNALDALPAEKGQIRIAAENKKEFIKVSIEDTGSGIAKDILDKIFDPFFTTKAKGTGLGLSVCKQIINKHEGEIVVKSDPGRGTSVVIRLPKRANKQESKKKESETL